MTRHGSGVNEECPPVRREVGQGPGGGTQKHAGAGSLATGRTPGRIEPGSSAWKAEILPLDYTCTRAAGPAQASGSRA